MVQATPRYVRQSFGVQGNTVDLSHQPQIAPIPNGLDFSAATATNSWSLDITQLIQVKAFGAIQGLIVNNQSNQYPLVITDPLTGYQESIPPFFFARIALETQVSNVLVFSSTASGTVNVPITLLNFKPAPLAYGVLSGGQSPSAPIYVDGDVPRTPAAASASAIVTGGTAITVATGPINGGKLVNPLTAAAQGIALAENAYPDMVGVPGSTDAAANGTTYLLVPGQDFDIPALAAGVTLKINAATSGHKFSVEVW